MLEDSVLINDEKTAKRDAGTFHQYTVVPCDLLVQIRDQGIVHALNAAVFAWRVGPGVMGKFGIYRDSNHFRIAFLELLQRVCEGQNLSRAHKRKVQWIEEQNDLFALELAQ